MANDELNRVWKSQETDEKLELPDRIIAKAKKHRQKQIIGIVVMSVTVLILVLFTLHYITSYKNDFALGLMLMISSLIFRVILEFAYLLKVENKIVSLDSKSYRSYLKKHYQSRMKINYVVTPLCFGLYIYGFAKLLPFFKKEFSAGFYTYILVSGGISFILLIGLIASSILKENRFLQILRD
ncbi:MAG: hypothetical protein AAGF87_03110 [Bacteroidota bacterium]